MQYYDSTNLSYIFNKFKEYMGKNNEIFVLLKSDL